jgi:hypothetical protein
MPFEAILLTYDELLGLDCPVTKIFDIKPHGATSLGLGGSHQHGDLATSVLENWIDEAENRPGTISNVLTRGRATINGWHVSVPSG